MRTTELVMLEASNVTKIAIEQRRDFFNLLHTVTDFLEFQIVEAFKLSHVLRGFQITGYQYQAAKAWWHTVPQLLQLAACS
ncbi:hypothetical protein OFN51_36770, partial [Escherichia coli]|nr:hypothetical protein [Escherichia coli]